MERTDHAAKAAETWDQIDIQKVRDVSWLAIPFLAESYARALAGDRPLSDVVEDELERRIGRSGNHLVGAAIVCGDMAGERSYFEGRRKLSFSAVHGFDISAESLRRFQPDGIRFEPHVMDVNDIVLERDMYDLVIGNHGLHHVYNLGGLFYQLHKATKKKGLLVIHEWIGPRYLQIPLRNFLVSALVLYLLYPTKQARTTHEGRAKGIWLQHHPTTFDPSEACNSEELEDQLTKYFKPLRVVHYGGLCYAIFEGRGHKLAKAEGWNGMRIRFVYWLEKMLTRIGLIKPLFISGVFEKRDNVMTPRVRSRVKLFRKARRYMRFVLGGGNLRTPKTLISPAPAAGAGSVGPPTETDRHAAPPAGRGAQPPTGSR